jgi:hypothetical protein
MKNTKFLGLGVVVGLAGCPAGDDSADDTNAVTMSGTMSTTMTTADTDPATSTGEEESSSGEAECPDDSISFEADIQPIFDDNCVTDCHIMGGNWQQLILEDAYDTIVDEESLQTQTVDELVLIAPGDPDNSYILHKLRGTQGDVVDPALSLLRMPSEEIECDPMEEGCSPDGTMIVEGDPLPDADIQLIEDWIVCGAPE